MADYNYTNKVSVNYDTPKKRDSRYHGRQRLSRQSTYRTPYQRDQVKAKRRLFVTDETDRSRHGRNRQYNHSTHTRTVHIYHYNVDENLTCLMKNMSTTINNVKKTMDGLIVQKEAPVKGNYTPVVEDISAAEFDDSEVLVEVNEGLHKQGDVAEGCTLTNSVVTPTTTTITTSSNSMSSVEDGPGELAENCSLTTDMRSVSIVHPTVTKKKNLIKGYINRLGQTQCHWYIVDGSIHDNTRQRFVDHITSFDPATRVVSSGNSPSSTPAVENAILFDDDKLIGLEECDIQPRPISGKLYVLSNDSFLTRGIDSECVDTVTEFPKI